MTQQLPSDSSPFFIAGGTLKGDAQSYVRRKADDDLYQGLLRGEFCYILTARQMGKSSLMVRVGARLQEAGIAVAILDLTAIGQNLRPEEWYGGLAIQLGYRLGMVDEVMSFWHAKPFVGPLQHWIKMVREVIVARCSHEHIVIFIDEIDMVRSLPFSADEFLAGIRQCYNERAEHQEMERLSFCLLGVAAPTDLIRDTRMTPFNIGRRIELQDFTSEEAAPLSRGLADRQRPAAGLLERVMHWTGGHPYLTQRTCLEVSQQTYSCRPRHVDDLCAALFFSHRAQERDDNLLFVRERMLRGDVDRGGLLDLYRRIRAGNVVRDDDTNPLAGPLQLSGIVRTIDGAFKVRNRIYSRVFDRRWIDAMMPDAELRRQKAAFRRGLRRAALVAALVVTLGVTLTLIAFQQGQARADRRLLYDTNMRLAQDAWNHSYVDRVEELLEATAPQPGQEDLRGFEWYLFQQLVRGDSWRSMQPYPILATNFSADAKLLCVAEYQQEDKQPNKLLLKVGYFRAQQGLYFLSVPTDAAFPRVIFSPDCKHATLSGPDHTIEQWNLQTGVRDSRFEGHKDRLSDLALSADGKILASADLSGVIKLWNPQNPEKELRTLPTQQSWPRSIALAPDGGLLAVADESLRVTLWNTSTGLARGELTSQDGSVTGVAFSPDSGHLLMAGKNGALEVWDIHQKRIVHTLSGHSGKIESVAFWPAGQLLATGSWDRTAKLWSLVAGHELETVRGHGARVSSVSFSPNGKYLITGSFDHAIKIWDIGSQELLRTPDMPKSYLATTFSATNELLTFGINQDNQAKLWDLSTGGEVTRLGEPEGTLLCAAFSADRKLLATGGLGKEVKLWNLATGALITSFKNGSAYVYTLAFSPNGKLLISGDYDRVLRLWDVATGEEKAQLKGNFDNSYVAIFSPDGQQLASGTREGAVQLWDVAGQKVVRIFRGHIGTVRAIAFSADGKWLATGADDHTLRLWDARSGKIVRTLGLADVLQRMTFSPDGRRLITGGADGAIRVWDIFSGQELMSLPGHTDEVTSITFSNDGSTLATSGADGVIRVWSSMRKEQETDIFSLPRSCPSCP